MGEEEERLGEEEERVGGRGGEGWRKRRRGLEEEEERVGGRGGEGWRKKRRGSGEEGYIKGVISLDSEKAYMVQEEA